MRVTLSQYAGVLAGIAEDHPLDTILRNESVPPSAWPVAEQAWPERLEVDTDAADQFEELLDAARRRYGRRVVPLDEDLDVWLDFVRHWAAAADPLQFLSHHMLRPSDLLRLHRLWSTRMLDDAQLRERAMFVLGREPGAIPVLTIGAAPVVPPEPAVENVPSVEIEVPAVDPTDDDEPVRGGFGPLLVQLPAPAVMASGAPVAPAPKEDTAAAALPAAPTAVSLEEHARLCAAVDADPLRGDDILRRASITPDEYARADAHWQRVIADDEVARARWLAAYGGAAR